MAHKVITTSAFLPTPEQIVAQELATIMEFNQRDAARLDAFWSAPVGLPGTPLPKQKLLYDTYFRHSEQFPGTLQTYMCFGSIRSGKTDGAIMLDTKLMLQYPGTRALGVRRLLSELHNTIIESIEKCYKNHGIEYRIRRGDSPRIYLPNGSEWIFMAMEKAEKSREGKPDTLSGSEFAIALIDEANELKESVYDTVMGRMSQRNLPAPVIQLIQNPPPEEHWTFKKLIEGDPGPHHFNLHFPVEDNRVNLGDEYVDDIKARYANSPTQYKKFYLGLFTPTIQGEAIYKDLFRRNVHVAAEPVRWCPDYPLFGCWDFGFVRPAFVVFQDDKNTGQILVLRAYLGKEEMIDRFAKRMKPLYEKMFPDAKWRHVADIAGKKRSDTSPKSAAELLEGVLGQGLEMQYTRIEYGIGILNELLTTILPKGAKSINGTIPAVIFDPGGAGVLADGFEFGYTQDPNAKKDEMKPASDPMYEHVMDAFRYGIVRCRTLTTKRPHENPRTKQWREMKDGKYAEDVVLDDDAEVYASYNFGRRGTTSS